MRSDRVFYNIALNVAESSKCLSRKIGAILVKDNIVICDGYNGPPRGMSHCNERYHHDNGETIISETTCPRILAGYKSGQGLHLCVAGHAERNCLNNAARLGIRTKDCKIYMNCPVPCKDCLIELINAGIEEIICTGFIYYDEMSKEILNDYGVKIKIRTYDFVV
jgi:dCMP deaminase